MIVSAAKTALMAYGFDTTDPLNSWLDQGKNEIEEAFDWPFLQTITTINALANASTLVLPSDFFRVISLRDQTNGTKLTYRDIVGFERDIDDPTDTGLPTIYTSTANNVLQLWQIPTTAVTYRCVYQNALTDINGLADGATLPGPSRLHYLYVLGAAYIALQVDNEEERSQTAQQAFQSGVNRLIRKYSSQNLDEARTVVDVMGYGA
jgi:hypothetical protein